MATHRKFLLFAAKHNLKCDAKTAHFTGKKPWSRTNWFTREALRRDIGHLVESEMFPGEKHPSEFNMEKHMQPIGELCQLHGEWARVDRVIQMTCWMQDSSKKNPSLDMVLTLKKTFRHWVLLALNQNKQLFWRRRNKLCFHNVLWNSHHNRM